MIYVVATKAQRHEEKKEIAKERGIKRNAFFSLSAPFILVCSLFFVASWRNSTLAASGKMIGLYRLYGGILSRKSRRRVLLEA